MDDGASTDAGGSKLRAALILSFGFWGLFCAFSATQNLESTLNNKHGLGSVSLGMIYLSFVLWCIPGPRIVKKLGCRTSLIIGGLTYVLYIIANLTHFLLHYNGVLAPSAYDGFYLLVPTALVLGFGAAILWSAQGTYLTNVAGQAELGKFNGIFFFIFQSTQIVGNLISALVLGKVADGVYTKSEVVLFIVFSVLSAVGVCGFLFLRPVRIRRKSSAVDTVSLGAELKEVILLAFQDNRMALMLPVIFYSGVSLAALAGKFTSTVVAGLLSKGDVGFVMMGFGFTDAVGSLLFGRLSDRVGRFPTIVAGFVAQVIFFAGLLIWDYTSAALWTDTNKYLLLISGAALFGIGDAVWNTIVNAILGTFFEDNTEVAFSNLKLWQSLGFAIMFFVNPFLSLGACNGITLGLLVLQAACVAWLHYRVASIDGDSPFAADSPKHERLVDEYTYA